MFNQQAFTEADKQATQQTIDQQIADNPVLLYMKGSPERPQCGFSATAVRVLSACGVDFGFVDILQHPDIRHVLPEHKQWPTFPQLYINGELIGGSDIILEMFEAGELQEKLTTITNP